MKPKKRLLRQGVVRNSHLPHGFAPPSLDELQDDGSRTPWSAQRRPMRRIEKPRRSEVCSHEVTAGRRIRNGAHGRVPATQPALPGNLDSCYDVSRMCLSPTSLGCLRVGDGSRCWSGSRHIESQRSVGKSSKTCARGRTVFPSP